MVEITIYAEGFAPVILRCKAHMADIVAKTIADTCDNVKRVEFVNKNGLRIEMSRSA